MKTLCNMMEFLAKNEEWLTKPSHGAMKTPLNGQVVEIHSKTSNFVVTSSKIVAKETKKSNINFNLQWLLRPAITHGKSMKMLILYLQQF